jgi:CMP-N,N'-diacetyllegionaminic acid synthase
MKIIAMIPARLGSQRVPKKNLRFINGKPLIYYAIEAAKAANCFDEIYINSESDIFSEIAEKLGVKYYKRNQELASNTANNDDFAYDFIKNVNGDVLIQLLPTSPLILPQEISNFVDKIIKTKCDTLISVANHQIAGIFKGSGINFKAQEPHISSQEMVPIQTYATVLMGWTYKKFISNMEIYGFAYHGPSGVTDVFPIQGLSTIDIDNEEDFHLAEAALIYRKNSISSSGIGSIKYYDSDNEIDKKDIENDVPSILLKDGVTNHNFSNENLSIANLKKIIDSKDNSKSWSHRIINTENNSATLISQLPGEGNRLHYHDDWNEWWYIVSGNWEWNIDSKKLTVSAGDVVYIEKNKLHKITAIGDKPAVRLAVSKDGVSHIYPGEACN